MKRQYIFHSLFFMLVFTFNVHSQIRNINAMQGSWTGQWINSFYSSTGSILVTITVDQVHQTAHADWNVGGNILGQPRAPFTSDITFNSTGFTVGFHSDIWGDVTGTGTYATGAYSGGAANCPNPNASNITVSGTFGSLNITGTFTFNWAPAGSNPINGTVALTKQNPISVPTNLTLTENPPRTINVGWQDNATNETGYRIERKTLPSGSWTQVGTTAANVHTFIDNNSIAAGTQYSYRVTGYNTNTESEFSSEMNITTTATSVGDFAIVPSDYMLLQNYPNPFNPSTVIRYNLPSESIVNISVYTILGEQISTLTNEVQTVGQHESKFDAKDKTSGIYLVKMVAESIASGTNFVGVKKMLLIK